MEINADQALKQWQEKPHDHDRFATWYRLEYPSFLYHALRVTSGNTAWAEDHCQDAIVALTQSNALSSMKSAQHARAYVRRAIVHRHIDDVRKRTRETHLEANKEPHGNSTPDDSLNFAEVYEHLCRQLTEDDQHLLGLLINGDTLSEMAQSLDANYSAVAVRVHRIRNKIKDLVNNA